MPLIWMIRHAESQANVGGRTAHPAGIELTPRGHEQARILAESFRQAPDLIVASSFVRAQQTADPLRLRFPNAKTSTAPVHEFTYLDPDRFKDTTYAERMPFAAAYWDRCDPAYVDGAEAESFADLMRRVDQFADSLTEIDAEFAVIFSHGMFMQALLWRLISGQGEMTPEAMRGCRSFMLSFDIPNTATIKLRVEDDHRLWIAPIERPAFPL